MEVGDVEVGDVDMSTGAEGRLDEVVVTVDRRKKDLQKYSGIAASLLREQLSRVGITNVRELSSMVPGLQIGVQEGNTEVYIRGVGSDNNTELGDPRGRAAPRRRLHPASARRRLDVLRHRARRGEQRPAGYPARPQRAWAARSTSSPRAPSWASSVPTPRRRSARSPSGATRAWSTSRSATRWRFRFAGFSEVHDPYWQNAGPLYDITPAENADAYAFRGH